MIDDSETVRTSLRIKKPTKFFGDPLRNSVKLIDEVQDLPSECAPGSSPSPRKPLVRDRPQAGSMEMSSTYFALFLLSFSNFFSCILLLMFYCQVFVWDRAAISFKLIWVQLSCSPINFGLSTKIVPRGSASPTVAPRFKPMFSLDGNVNPTRRWLNSPGRQTSGRSLSAISHRMVENGSSEN